MSPVSSPLSASPYLTVAEVVCYIGVSRRTILLPGRIRRFDRIAIDSWVRDHAVPAQAEGRRR